MQNSRWYKSWHEYENHHVWHWLTFLGLVLVVGVLMRNQIKDWIYDTTSPDTLLRIPDIQAVLSLDPAIQTVSVGQTFIANIILDTGERPIDAVDIYSLHYDPSILEVVDSISSQEGVQIEPSNILSATAVNSVDSKTGTIKLGRLTGGGRTFNGKGVLATIHFKAIAPGESYLKFDFNKGSSTDTNVAHNGRDQLFRVVDAIYSVTDNE